MSNHVNPLHVVLERLDCTERSKGAFYPWDEVNNWPSGVLDVLVANGLLQPAQPATAIECDGCEENCMMPVTVYPAQDDKPGRAFITCDKRDDIGRVRVDFRRMGQWTCSPERVADVLARLLDTRRSDGDGASRRWDVGVLKGVKHSAHVVLAIERELRLHVAGHDLALADVLELGDKGLAVDRRALTRCVDSPVGAAGDSLSRESRVERLRKRRNELKAARVRNFNQVLAEEEGCSTSAIKQLLAEKQPPKNWLGLSPVSKGTVSKKPKTRY